MLNKTQTQTQNFLDIILVTEANYLVSFFAAYQRRCNLKPRMCDASSLTHMTDFARVGCENIIHSK